MSHHVVLIAAGLIFVLEHFTFGLQRSALLIAREAGSDLLVSILLPRWFPAVWLLSIAKWSLLVYVAFSWSLAVAAGLLVASFATSLLPIPYRLYIPVFRARVAEVKQESPEGGVQLETILKMSAIHDNFKDK